MKIQTTHPCKSMYLCVSLHQNTVVTKGNEGRQKEINRVHLLIGLLKSHFYSHRPKFSTSVNVSISESSKLAENMTHPPDVPFAETSLQDGKQQISSTPVRTVVSLKAVSILQHSTNFCVHCNCVTPGVRWNQHQALCLKNS